MERSSRSVLRCAAPLPERPFAEGRRPVPPLFQPHAPSLPPSLVVPTSSPPSSTALSFACMGVAVPSSQCSTSHGLCPSLHREPTPKHPTTQHPLPSSLSPPPSSSHLALPPHIHANHLTAPHRMPSHTNAHVPRRVVIYPATSSSQRRPCVESGRTSHSALGTLLQGDT